MQIMNQEYICLKKDRKSQEHNQMYADKISINIRKLFLTLYVDICKTIFKSYFNFYRILSQITGYEFVADGIESYQKDGISDAFRY